MVFEPNDSLYQFYTAVYEAVLRFVTVVYDMILSSVL